MTKEGLIKEMKEYSGSSFMTITELTRWSGRSQEYIRSLIHALDWVAASEERSKSFFIPDVADAIMKRQGVDETDIRSFLMNSVDRDHYRDDLIGEQARDKKVSICTDTALRRDAVALADKVGIKNASQLLDIKPNTLGGWRYARTLEEERMESGVYEGIENEPEADLFSRLAETYGLDLEDIKARRKRYAERYRYLMR